MAISGEEVLIQRPLFKLNVKNTCIFLFLIFAASCVTLVKKETQTAIFFFSRMIQKITMRWDDNNNINIK